MSTTIRYAALAALAALAAPVHAADPWADAVVDFDSGSGAGSRFDDPTTTLGAPTRITESFETAPVTPFFPVGGTAEAVSIGEGGSLTVRFDEPVADDPNNPFGIDLLIFGNAFFLTSEFPITPTTTATSVFSEGGVISVSDNGVDFVTVPGLDADGLYPAAAFLDFDLGEASGPSDYTLPVDPSYNPIGQTPAEVYAGYAGSGGGTGVDIGVIGFDSISYVRVTNPIGSGATPEIDAFADVRAVPEPSAVLLGVIAAGCLAIRVR